MRTPLLEETDEALLVAELHTLYATKRDFFTEEDVARFDALRDRYASVQLEAPYHLTDWSVEAQDLLRSLTATIPEREELLKALIATCETLRFKLAGRRFEDGEERDNFVNFLSSLDSLVIHQDIGGLLAWQLQVDTYL